ncbi:hypothetical protein [Streptomyces bacillaris]
MVDRAPARSRGARTGARTRAAPGTGSGGRTGGTEARPGTGGSGGTRGTGDTGTPGGRARDPRLARRRPALRTPAPGHGPDASRAADAAAPTPTERPA